MNPYQAYRQQQVIGWSRIDMLLALYDGAIERLEKALDALRQGDDPTAQALLVRASLVVSGLVAGVRQEYGEMAQNFMRLYEYVLFSIHTGSVDKIDGALTVLRTLREGFLAIRSEALRQERCGEIPPVDATQTLQTSA